MALRAEEKRILATGNCTNLCFNEHNPQDRAGLIVVEDLSNGKIVSFLKRHVPMLTDDCVLRLYRENWYGRKVSLVIGNKLYSAWNFDKREIEQYAEGKRPAGASVCPEEFGRKIQSILVQKARWYEKGRQKKKRKDATYLRSGVFFYCIFYTEKSISIVFITITKFKKNIFLFRIFLNVI